MRRGGYWGPLVVIAILAVFFILAVTAITTIFGHTEAAVNVTNMTNETRENYNITVGMVQTGQITLNGLSYILMAAFVIFGAIGLIVIFKKGR